MLRLLLVASNGAFVAVISRLLRGPTQPSWSWRFEITVAIQGAVVRYLGGLRGESLRKLSAGAPPPSAAVAALPFEVVAGPVEGAWMRADGSGIPGSGRGVVLFLHGGGYAVGSVATHRDFAGRMVLAGGFDLFSLEYRLAPEHPHPAAVEDALAAYRWLRDAGHAADEIAVAGDSAGGGLAMALLVSLRDAGEALPVAAGLVCPWVDLGCSLPSIAANAKTDYLAADTLRRWAQDYTAGAPLDAPTISPLHADLTGLPPLYIQVGEAEILRDDALRLAVGAEKAGVTVRLEREPEMPHDWHMLAGVDPRGQRSIEALSAFLRARLDAAALG